ncbi:MAG: response regulator [Nitrospira sp.]|nr:response regulator [Nitrospira sp.]
MHPLLARQLKRVGLDQDHPPPTPEVWGEILERISQSYVEADQGHALLERSLALSSEEMRNLYAQLKQTSETQLAQERNKLQAVLQAMGDGLCVVDAAWKIQMVNHQAEVLFGKTASILVESPVYRMISPGPEEYREDCLITDSTLPPLASGEPYRTEDGLLVTGDGQLVAIALVVTPMLLDGVVMGAVLVFRDITRQKQIERERQQTEGVLRRIQSGLSELAKSPQIYGGNLQDAFRTITRVAAECLHSERVSIWFFTGDRSAIQCADLYQLTTRAHTQGAVLSAIEYPKYFQELDTERIVAAHEAQRDSRTAEFTTNYLTPLGITSMLDVPIRSEGKMVGVICHEHIGPMRCWTLEEQHFAASVANTVALAMEAADRRRVEQALRTSEGRLTTTVQSTNIGIWDWDLTSNEVYLSPEWKRQLGYDEDELDNTFQEWERRIHPHDHDRAMGTIESYLSGRTSGLEIEHRLQHKDGSYRWILARGTMIKNEADLSSRIMGIHLDVTDRKVGEEQLRLAKDAAEAASLAKSQFLANMSHEIRTPMNGVLGMAELLLRCTLDDKERHLVESIQRSGTALLSIINDILDFSKIEAGKLQLERIPFDVRRTIQEAIDLSGPIAQRKQLKLSLHMDPDIPTYLLGDPTRLGQVLVNLVGNAVKFTDRGSVEVSVTSENLSDQQHGLSVTVRDTGIGLTSAVQTHIFDAFSQADGSTTRKYGGTGLGLAIVKQLVTLMGGGIELESRVGEGSTFRFTALFTRCELAQHPVTVSEVSTTVRSVPTDLHAQPQKELHILLVEDNPVNREVASGMLETFACRIDIAENGREALAATETKKYDLVFMDCQMPEMDGLTATRLIREREAKEAPAARVPRVPIVALTAHAMQGDRELCLAAGMDDYLTKPFTLTQLEDVLVRWISDNNTKQTPRVASGTPDALVTGGQGPTAAGGGGQRSDPMADTAILDQSALAAIRVLQRPGHSDIFTRIVSQYVETSREMVARVRQGVLSKDAAELRAAAHRLKSSSAQLGAVALAADCRELELMGASGELNRAGEVLSRFELHYASACAALQEELEKGRPAA